MDRPSIAVLPTAPGSDELMGALRSDPARHVLLCFGEQGALSAAIRIDTPGWVRRMVDVAEQTGAGMVYGDYISTLDRGCVRRPLIDYAPGAVRDDFDFGPLVLIARDRVEEALQRFGTLSDTRWSGWYELRLKLSGVADVIRIAGLNYEVTEPEDSASSAAHFAYLDPRNRALQVERERVCTRHLQAVGAFLPPRHRRADTRDGAVFPVEASVIIPVRNRARTIGDAVRSTLKQETNFAFNVIVVDNHSHDGTSGVLAELSAGDPRVVVLCPERDDLQIGGCWNLAVRSPHCGRYAVQLDSDDVYAHDAALATMVETMRGGGYAMAVGAYRLVDFDLNDVAPGVIDHREWTADNGHNNLLRVNGIGAPRAFDTAVLRANPFPDVSYGEDYAVALALSRHQRIARVFEPLYLCRRWEGNSDAAPSVEVVNQRNAYKDELRTREIQARQLLVATTETAKALGQPGASRVGAS